MATYLLRPHDGGKDIAIPPGKTTIGRGPFLGVTDKRVSRSHAVLELRDGNLTVLPLHANPTFYSKGGVKEKCVALKQNEVQDLVSGNIISLLPDALFFEIVYEESLSKNGLTTEGVNSSKSMTADSLPPVVADDHEKPSTSSKVPPESFLDEFLDSRLSVETGPSAATQTWKKKKESNELLDTETLKVGKEAKEFPDSSSVPTASKGNTVSASKPQVTPAPLLQKTRKLPSWLIESTSSEMRSPAKKAGNRKGKGSASSTGDKTATHKCTNKGGKTAQKPSSLPQKKQVISDSVSDEEFIACDDDEQSRPLKKKGNEPKILKKRASTDIQESDDDIKPVRHKKPKRALSDDDDDDDDVPTTPTKNQAKPAKPVVAVRDELSSGTTVAFEKGVGTKTPEKDESTTSTPPPCPYGSKCYRKNPLHFKEYSHLDKDSKTDNDDDDDDDDAGKAAGDSHEDDDDRPECPYGTSCYRRNPQHKRDFKHTEAPGRSKRKKSKHKSVLNNDSDDDGPNTYDYNDSFLDDGDDGEGSGSSYSAGSDDSDWKPQGGDDDDEEEDVTELLTEARGFLRSKKMAKPV